MSNYKLTKLNNKSKVGLVERSLTTGDHFLIYTYDLEEKE